VGSPTSGVRRELGLGDLFENTLLLVNEQRETLALGRFLWEQIEHIRANNYAGPTLLFAGVLDELTQKTIYKKSQSFYDDSGKRLMSTLGTLSYAKDYSGNNWRMLEQTILNKGHWQVPILTGQDYSLSQWIDELKNLVPIRNQAAHKARVDEAEFEVFIEAFFGSATKGVGLFSGLLLAWKA